MKTKRKPKSKSKTERPETAPASKRDAARELRSINSTIRLMRADQERTATQIVFAARQMCAQSPPKGKEWVGLRDSTREQLGTFFFCRELLGRLEEKRNSMLPKTAKRGAAR